MKRIIITVILILGAILIITSCGTKKIEEDPKVSLKFDVSNLTDVEFQSIGTKELQNASKSDLKNVEFTLEVNNSNKILNRKIIVPDIKTTANSYDRERYWFGQSSCHDNSIENFAKYDNKFILYSKGLDEHAIKNIFNTLEIRISWTTKNHKIKQKVYKLGEVIQFK